MTRIKCLLTVWREAGLLFWGIFENNMSARKDWRKTSFGEGDDWWLSVSFTAFSAVTLYPLSYSRNWADVVLVGKITECSLTATPAVLLPQHPRACTGLGKKLFLREISQSAHILAPRNGISWKSLFWLWHEGVQVKESIISCRCVDKSKGAVAQWKDPVGGEGSQWSLWAFKTDPKGRGRCGGPGAMLHFSNPHCRAYCLL